ncbi:hypothetical protein CBL_07134 [Carabus blaptoides fortunei]
MFCYIEVYWINGGQCLLISDPSDSDLRQPPEANLLAKFVKSHYPLYSSTSGTIKTKSTVRNSIYIPKKSLTTFLCPEVHMTSSFQKLHRRNFKVFFEYDSNSKKFQQARMY